MTARPTSAAGRLARLGFADATVARRYLEDDALAGLVDPLDEHFTDGLVDALGDVADPDLALLTLVRLMESLRGMPPHGEGGRDDGVAELIAALRRRGPGRDRLLAVIGASDALGDHLVAHPGHWRSVTDAVARTVADRTRDLVDAVRQEGDLEPQDTLRVAYRRELLGIAAIDLTSADPTRTLPETASALADLAEAALEAAVVIVGAEHPEDAASCRLAVVGMGKTGGRELNYISDVDVIFVVEPAEGVEEDAAVRAGTRLASRLMQVCSASTAHGSLWPVDAALRPEGKQGPLVRTVASHRVYYERWAKTWEFQALLKARVVAGDREVGEAYLGAVSPFVWEAASRENFVEDVQAMRRRVEEHVPPAEARRQLKLGPGGLRDVEFSVQLLQLVHGRADEDLRSGTTLQGLQALSDGGYVGRQDAAVLDEAYRFLRTLEHRIQLFRMRRTHLMPTSEQDLRRLGRALGHRGEPAEEVVRQWRRQARQVRRLHERLFYRPLLSAAARLSPEDVHLSPEAARERLAALGYRDPAGALRHIEALTSGMSRRAAIQRHLLPIMLGWFASEADPDAGLLTFRRVSETLGGTHWYLRLLRDEGSAAERLAHVLGRSRLAGDLLLAAPEAVRFLGDPTGLSPRNRADIEARMRSAAGRKHDAEEAVGAVRGIRRAELFRIAVADLLGELDLDDVGQALTDVTAATIQVGLEVALRAVGGRRGEELVTDVAIIGMGRLGGREVGYGSDADVLFVHRPHAGADEARAQDHAMDVVKELRGLLGAAGADPSIGLDADLRPEGRNGPLVRSLASYEEYYRRWALTWESQALLRAAPIAGDEDLGGAFVELIDRWRWPADGLDAAQVRDIRTLKARVEAERLPRGADPRTHFKLGRGGLSDVEWTIQLIQLEHAHENPALRTTSTTTALAAAADAGLVEEPAATSLRGAWELASLLRNAGMLFRGRPVDAVPSDLRDADGVARIIGMPPGSGQDLTEEYRRVARRSRAVVDELFYGQT